MTTTGIIGLRQNTPAAMRMLERLQYVGPATRWTMAKECHIDQYHAANIVRLMIRLGGLLHISGWSRPESGHGSYAPIYSIGPGANKPKPKQLTATVKSRNRRNSLIERFGDSLIAERICRSRRNGGADRIVIDGKTIYQRGQGVLA